MIESGLSSLGRHDICDQYVHLSAYKKHVAKSWCQVSNFVYFKLIFEAVLSQNLIDPFCDFAE